jgi:putative SOS response-associated peptidase YedK
MAKIHDRMPVILPSSTHVDWLAAKPLKREVLLTYQAPFPAEEMHSHPVGSAVNKVSNNDPSLTNATNDQPQSLWTLEG